MRSCSDAGLGGGRQRRSPRSRALGRRLASAAAGVDGDRRAAVRLLPGRPDHVGGGAAGAARRSRPTRDIDAAMAGNLCRCATYLRIRQAIHSAAGTVRRRRRPPQPPARPVGRAGVEEDAMDTAARRPPLLPARHRPRRRRPAARLLSRSASPAAAQAGAAAPTPRPSRRTRSSASRRTASSRSWPRTRRSARASRRCCRC